MVVSVSLTILRRPQVTSFVPWLVDRPVPGWAVESLETGVLAKLSTLGGVGVKTFIIGSPSCPATTQLLEDIRPVLDELLKVSHISAIWYSTVASDEVRLKALNGVAEYRLAETLDCVLPSPTVWVVAPDGRVVFDQRGYASGIAETVAAVAERLRD
jgi:hypothetical protein